MAQNADLDIVLSTLHTTRNNSIRPSFAKFALPSARHGCIGGTQVKKCPSCAGSGAFRSGSGDKKLTQCTTCLGRGFQTGSCGICLSSLKAAHEYQKAQLEMISCDQHGSCIVASSGKACGTNGDVKPGDKGPGEEMSNNGVDEDTSGGSKGATNKGKENENADGEEDAEQVTEERVDTPAR